MNHQPRDFSSTPKERLSPNSHRGRGTKPRGRGGRGGLQSQRNVQEYQGGNRPEWVAPKLGHKRDEPEWVAQGFGRRYSQQNQYLSPIGHRRSDARNEDRQNRNFGQTVHNQDQYDNEQFSPKNAQDFDASYEDQQMYRPIHDRRSTQDFGYEEENQRFDPYECDEGDRFYDNLPPPWNIRPSTSVDKTVDFWKLIQTGMIHFDGTRENYLPFRSAFLNCVHRLKVNLSYKVMALSAAMDKTKPELKELMNTAQFTPEGYRSVIVALEREFGGRGRLIQFHIAKLRNVGNVKVDDKRSLQVLSRYMHDYINTLCGFGLDSEGESTMLFSMIREKIPSSYMMQYNQWSKIQNKVRNLRSLLEWIDSVLDDLMEMSDIYHLTASLNNTTVNKTVNKTIASTKSTSTLWRTFAASQFSPEEEEQVHQVHAAYEDNMKCEIDGQDHPIYKCPKFIEMSPKERREHIFRNKRCMRCLSKGHIMKDCPRKWTCRQCLRPTIAPCCMDQGIDISDGRKR